MHASNITRLINYCKNMTIAAFFNATVIAVIIAILLYNQPPHWIPISIVLSFFWVAFALCTALFHEKRQQYKDYLDKLEGQKP